SLFPVPRSPLRTTHPDDILVLRYVHLSPPPLDHPLPRLRRRRRPRGGLRHPAWDYARRVRDPRGAPPQGADAAGAAPGEDPDLLRRHHLGREQAGGPRPGAAPPLPRRPARPLGRTDPGRDGVRAGTL